MYIIKIIKIVSVIHIKNSKDKIIYLNFFLINYRNLTNFLFVTHTYQISFVFLLKLLNIDLFFSIQKLIKFRKYFFFLIKKIIYENIKFKKKKFS